MLINAEGNLDRMYPSVKQEVTDDRDLFWLKVTFLQHKDTKGFIMIFINGANRACLNI